MTTRWGYSLTLGALWLAVMGSSLGVVVSSHLSREFYSEYSELQREEHQLQVEWGKYLLEQSAWAALSRVEQLAVEKLDMQVPRLEDIVMVNRVTVTRTPSKQVGVVQ